MDDRIKPFNWTERPQKGIRFCKTAVGFYEISDDGFVYSPWICQYQSYAAGLAAITADYNDKVKSLLLDKPPIKNALGFTIPQTLDDLLALIPECKPSTREELPDSAYIDNLAGRQAVKFARAENHGWNMACMIIRKRIEAITAENAKRVE